GHRGLDVDVVLLVGRSRVARTPLSDVGTCVGVALLNDRSLVVATVVGVALVDFCAGGGVVGLADAGGVALAALIDFSRLAVADLIDAGIVETAFLAAGGIVAITFLNNTQRAVIGSLFCVGFVALAVLANIDRRLGSTFLNGDGIVLCTVLVNVGSARVSKCGTGDGNKYSNGQKRFTSAHESLPLIKSILSVMSEVERVAAVTTLTVGSLETE